MEEASSGRCCFFVLVLHLLCLLFVCLSPNLTGASPSPSSKTRTEELDDSRPLIRGWFKAPSTACTLSSVSAPSIGPFPALLTFNSSKSIVAFEPVGVQQLCPLRGAEGLYEVVCSSPQGAATAKAVSRPAPDLTYRLSLEEISISGMFAKLIGTSVKNLLARKEYQGENLINKMFRWLLERKANNEVYTLDCEGVGTYSNPRFSYSSFFGELLLAAYEDRNFPFAAIPNFAIE